MTVRYGYSHFASGTDESAELEQILNDAWNEDLRYMTNQDLSLGPGVDQWNNGTDNADELRRLMTVRRTALDRIGEQAIKLGAPLATIEEALVPVYLHHRYAAESVATALGGQDYVYALRGDGREPVAGYRLRGSKLRSTPSCRRSRRTRWPCLQISLRKSRRDQPASLGRAKRFRG